MSYNPDLTERVRHTLAHISDVKEIKMFGSIGFKVNDKLAIGVGDHADHVMMVRVGPDVYAEALKQKGAKPAIMRGREMKGYVFLTEEAIQTDEDLNYWLNLALEFNSTLSNKK